MVNISAVMKIKAAGILIDEISVSAYIKVLLEWNILRGKKSCRARDKMKLNNLIMAALVLCIERCS